MIVSFFKKVVPVQINQYKFENVWKVFLWFGLSTVQRKSPSLNVQSLNEKQGCGGSQIYHFEETFRTVSILMVYIFLFHVVWIELRLKIYLVHCRRAKIFI